MKSRLLSVPQFIALFVIVISALTLARLADDARELHALYQQVQTLEQSKVALDSEIAELQSEIDASAKPGWVELMVRKWLHWTRAGETLIVVKSSSGAAAATAQSQPGQAGSLPTHWQQWVNYFLGSIP